MKIAFALVAVFWWIAIWGLSDLLTEHWTREAKFQMYIALLIAIAAIIGIFPQLMDRL